MDSVLDSLEFLFLHDDFRTDFIQLQEEWMLTLFVIATADREDSD